MQGPTLDLDSVTPALTKMAAGALALASVACGAGPQGVPTLAIEAAPAPTAEVPAAAPIKAKARAAASGADESRAAADEMYPVRCAICHGPQGKGDSPAAAAVRPRPRDFTSTTWQATVTDARIEKVILEGGAAVGISPIMPASPDLEERRQILRALRVKVRSFGSKAR